MRDLFFQALLVAFLPACANCGALYVALCGDDTNPGTSDAPFRTLGRAVQTVRPGDTVIVRDGTYGHEDSVTSGDGRNAAQASPVVLTRSGSTGAWITITAEHKWGAVLDCELMCDAYFDLKNASFISIENFVITRGYKEGIHSNDAAHDIRLRGNRIENIANRDTATALGLSGMYTSRDCRRFTIDGNVFHNIGRNNASQLDHGLYLHGSGYTIINNLFYDITKGWSIQAADGLNDVLIANNTFAFANESNRGGQILLWNTVSNVVIRNNIFYKPIRAAISRYRAVLTNCSIDHNLLFGATDMILETNGCSVLENQTGVDPMFLNADTFPYDFRLQPDSPAISTGVKVPGIALDFDGVPRLGMDQDLGAYVFIR